MIRKNMKLTIGIVMGLMITSISVYAVNNLSASSISIDKSKMNKVENNNLQSALDYLYNQSEKNNLITIESGVLHKSQTYLGIVYLDPTNLEAKCTSANSISTTGTKTGCMKWYIYKDLGDSYKMILDHNTTARQAWNTKKDEQHPYGTNVEFKENNGNLVYNELMLLQSSDTANGGSDWKVNRQGVTSISELTLIGADEVAEITEYKAIRNTNWTNTSGWFCLDTNQKDNLTPYCEKAQGTSNYSWLFDNLGWTDYTCISSGCNYTDTTNSAGYWTKTAYGEAGAGSLVWSVDRYGSLSYIGGAYNPYVGVRPVITIPKSLFN